MDRKKLNFVGNKKRSVATRIHRSILIIVTGIMAIELIWTILDSQWLRAFLIVMIMAVIVAPTLVEDRLPVRIPAEFLVLPALLAFAALFLGEFRNYYEIFWWWDLTLHGFSGLLLGILGFLLIYVLNEDPRIDLHLQPRFVALFAFLFAVAVGLAWEILEFAIDRIAGTNMQKPHPGDPSGLSDTMWDLIVNTLGALVISLYGWHYLRNPGQSFIERWIRKFVERNPTLFGL
jgi:uncharacterized membrane protein YjdF